MNTGSGVLLALPWPSRPGVSGPRAGLPGTGVPGAPPCAAVRPPLARARGKAAFAAPATPQAALAVQPGQPTMHNYITGAVGDGASGPPQRRGPA
jgi:hypothetical protein